MRLEVRLTSPKLIRNYTDKLNTADRIADITNNLWRYLQRMLYTLSLMEIFYKKVHATKYIEENVNNSTMRRKILKLLRLIQKKTSLYLVQIVMKDRTVEDILHEFYE